jgi:hypothetical protein
MSDVPALRIEPPAFLAEPALAAVMAALPEARVVGGAVRDGLAGCAVGDVDLATPRTPELVTQALQAAGLRTVPTGLDHGTVTALSPPGLRSPRCGATSKPTDAMRSSRSPMTGARTRRGAISPSTPCR